MIIGMRCVETLGCADSVLLFDGVLVFDIEGLSSGRLRSNLGRFSFTGSPAHKALISMG